MIAIGRQVLERQHGNGLLYGRSPRWRRGAVRFGEIQPVEADDDKHGNEHADRRDVQLAPGVVRDRFATIDVLLALYAFRRQFVCPGEDQDDGKAEHTKHQQEFQNPVGRSRNVHNQFCNLQNQPPGHQVRYGDSEYVAPF